MLTRSLGAAVIEIVRRDPECVKRIKSSLADVLPDALGIAGAVRNIGMGALWNGAPDDEDYAYICGGIAEATSDALNRAVMEAKTGHTLAMISKALPVHRDTNGTAHTATGVKLVGGGDCVFDWHATLNVSNPLIYRSVKDFDAAAGAVQFSSYAGDA